jgi:hypothetical protein
VRLSLNPPGRPATVAWFEWLGIPLAIAELTAFGPGARALTSASIMLLLVVAVSRGRSGAARWLFTICLAYYFVMQAYDLAGGRVALGAPDWALMAAALVQLWLLWSPATTSWLTSGRKLSRS